MSHKNLKSFLFSTILASLIIFLCGCLSNKPPKIINASFGLSEEQITDYQIAAKSGDGYAASKLSNYFTYIKNDHIAGFYWLSLAATNNFADSQMLLGQCYLEGFYNCQIDTNIARYWYEKATQNGCKQAQVELNKIH